MNIRDLRKQKGLTLKELGAKVGCSESSMSQYETGRRKPDYKTLLKIAEELGADVDFLLTGETSPRPPISVDDIKLALWDGEQGMTDEQYQEIKDFADYLKMKNKP